MNASATMARLLVLALASKACLGQQFLQGQNGQNAWSQQSSGNYQGDPYGNNGQDDYGNSPNGFNGLTPPGQCPVMTELGSAAKLVVQPWAWFRTVNIVTSSNQMSDASGVSAPSAGVVQPIAQGSSDSTLLPDTAEYRALAQVRQTIRWPLQPTMTLYNPANGLEISKIVNPLFIWDTTQEIFDCNGQLLGKVRYQFSWANLFTNGYVKHEVENAQGNHIANLLQETLTEAFWASGQHFIYIADLSGSALASMRRPTGGWQLGPFGEYFECDIQMQTMNAPVSPPAMNPEFLSLVLANAMAGEHLLGPYISVIVYPILIMLILCSCTCCGIGCDHVRYWLTCCGLCACFGLCSSQQSGKSVQDTANEEKESLIATAKNASGQGGGSLFNCCSRRQPTLVAPTMQH